MVQVNYLSLVHHIQYTHHIVFTIAQCKVTLTGIVKQHH